MSEKVRTTFEAAKICGVYPTTIINWIKQGRLKAYTTPGGHRRILQPDLAAFMERYGMPGSERLRQSRRGVMIVEDDPVVGSLLKKAFQREAGDMEVQWMRNGIEALIALGKAPPDLVILDVVMKVVDGARVLSTLRSDPKTKGIRVIGITGKTLSPEKLRFMKRHTEAFYHKPFDVKELIRKSLALLNLTEAVQARA